MKRDLSFPGEECHGFYWNDTLAQAQYNFAYWEEFFQDLQRALLDGKEHVQDGHAMVRVTSALVKKVTDMYEYRKENVRVLREERDDAIRETMVPEESGVCPEEAARSNA